MLGPLRGRGQKRWPNGMLPSHEGWKYLLSPRGVMAIEFPQNEEISGEGKNRERKGVGSAIRRRRANRGSVNIEKRREEELFGEMLIPT